MAGFGYVCAVLLALVFVRAGTAKVARPAATAAGFAALGVPAAPAIARAVPLVELALAVALLAVPRAGGIAALVLLAGFSAFLARTVRAGVTVGCNCFGQAGAEPVSGRDLVRNAMLGLLAAAALGATRPTRPSAGAVATAVAAVAVDAVTLRLVGSWRGAQRDRRG
ncbi:MAG: hypothetical protein DLM65_03825 [Candidatus Aeolococcus gillhamiae]|uniref:Methylamine utilisation protein MauE domain-containing protein n=1 Tax=Candidatus Aeolococcus gillhamiae TaxID=3127015 RepID=A0A2W5ZAX4_9BACT|nr:MAG: hypothetical protein DLM65_03825 [Candidatus Dormibacter sp. RRmetagenome_bin12]